MSKKLFALIQTLLILGSFAKAHAGPMMVSANSYSGLAGRMNNISYAMRPAAPQNNPNLFDRRAAAEQRMAGFQRQNEQRHIAAQAQQEQWRQQFDERHAAAERRVDEWKKQDDQRRIAAQAQQDKWKQDFEERHAAAVRKEEQFKRDDEARRKAAQEKMKEWNKQFDERHAAAQQGFDHWHATR